MDQANNVQAAIDAGKEIATSVQNIKYVGEIPIIIAPGGGTSMLTNVLAEQDARAAAPRRLHGTAQLGNERGFIDHVNRFKDNETVIFYDRTSLMAVYDYHKTVPQGLESGSVPARDTFARWGKHRATFTPEISDEWKAWIDGASKLLGQKEFAEFIDEHVRDIAPQTEDRKTPTAADLATLALNLKIMADYTMESVMNPTTGEYTLAAKEEHKTVSSTRIPAEFDIEIPIHTGGPKMRIVCKLRFRKSDNGPKFAWVVPGAAALQRQAMEELMMSERGETQLPVMAGKPE